LLMNLKQLMLSRMLLQLKRALLVLLVLSC
jgi:hypothetical protein